MSDIDDIPNATKLIGWIFNGDVNDLIITFESIVDHLRQLEYYRGVLQPTDERYTYLNHFRSDS